MGNQLVWPVSGIKPLCSNCEISFLLVYIFLPETFASAPNTSTNRDTHCVSYSSSVIGIVLNKNGMVDLDPRVNVVL